MEILPLQSLYTVTLYALYTVTLYALYTVTLYTLSRPAIIQLSLLHSSKVNSEPNDILELITVNCVILAIKVALRHAKSSIF